MELADIQKRLRDAIKQSGIEQKEIAKKVGVSPQTISKYMCKDVFRLSIQWQNCVVFRCVERLYIRDKRKILILKMTAIFG